MSDWSLVSTVLSLVSTASILLLSFLSTAAISVFTCSKPRVVITAKSSRVTRFGVRVFSYCYDTIALSVSQVFLVVLHVCVGLFVGVKYVQWVKYFFSLTE